MGEGLLRTRISNLNENCLLTEYQYGFRSLHSTVTALLDITNKWYLNIDKGGTLYGGIP